MRSAVPDLEAPRVDEDAESPTVPTIVLAPWRFNEAASMKTRRAVGEVAAYVEIGTLQ